jgi:hypothetical protein
MALIQIKLYDDAVDAAPSQVSTIYIDDEFSLCTYECVIDLIRDLVCRL